MFQSFQLLKPSAIKLAITVFAHCSSETIGTFWNAWNIWNET